jgi:putative ABC transport system permease protein
VVRKTTTIMTALGIALTVAVLLAILALVNGLRTTLSASGDPLQCGAAQGLGIGTGQQLHADAVPGPEVQTRHRHLGRDGQPLASLEVVTVMNLSARTTPKAPTSWSAGCNRRESRCGATCKSRAGAGSSRGSANWWWASRGGRFPEAQIGKKVRFRAAAIGTSWA